MGSQALQEIKLLCGSGAKDELQKLKNTVSTIEAVLLDAEQKRSTNHQVQDWLRKLEVELYEADDLNDDLSTRVLRHSLIHNKKNMAANKFQEGSKWKRSHKKECVVVSGMGMRQLLSWWTYENLCSPISVTNYA